MIIVGVDTGGTFTDFIYKDGDSWGVYKLLSTPANPAEAVVNGLKRIAGGGQAASCTARPWPPTPSWSEKGSRRRSSPTGNSKTSSKSGARTVPASTTWPTARSRTLPRSELRFGVTGRVRCSGEIHEELDVEEARACGASVRASGAESVAVCFLFSYLNPEPRTQDERTAGRTRRPGVAVSPNPLRVPGIRTDLHHGHQRLCLPQNEKLHLVSDGSSGPRGQPARDAVQRRVHFRGNVHVGIGAHHSFRSGGRRGGSI